MAATIPSTIPLAAGDRTLLFTEVKLIFLEHDLRDVFAHKNNKSLRDTLSHKRYKTLEAMVSANHAKSMSKPLGEFLASLKAMNDTQYRKFLNAHGDNVYCHFRMAPGHERSQKGLYCYTLEDEVVYIGRSFDPFSKRVDQGYGKIHPKNCYIDGQSTNCHLNSLIAIAHQGIRFFVCPLLIDTEIEFLERTLIRTRRSKWNVALNR